MSAPKMIACLLLRDELTPLLECIHLTLLKDACLKEGNGEAPIARFGEILKESLKRQKHARDWYLHGTQSEDEVPALLPMAHRDDLRHPEVVAYVEALCRAYSWCLIPWGVSGTGLMLALITPEDALFRKIMQYLAVAPRNLLVSSYTIEQIREKQFRGAIFRCPGDSSISALWEYGRGPSESVLALSVEQQGAVSILPAQVELVSEAHGYQFAPVRRRWVRILDEHALSEYVATRATIVTGSGLDEKVAWLALQDFAGVADFVNRDRLSFGIKALESVPWIYIPPHDDERWEIYINQDPQVTERLLTSEGLTRAPHFFHSFFC
jgi:hypothetical protein